MSDPVEVYRVESDVALDQLIWRRYRRATPRLVERTLDLNPGLAHLGPLIPAGTEVMVPLDRPVSEKALDYVRLWD